MRMNRIKQKLLSAISRDARISNKRMNILAIFLIFAILILLLGIMRQTLGMFSRSFVITDSAMAAKFDITITAPKEFWLEQGEGDLEYYFLSDTDIQAFVFEVTNNSEAELFCKPHITTSDITYRIYVEDEAVTGFRVAAKETVNFWLIIAPAGLDANIKNAEFFIDIRQMDGM